MPNNLLTDRKVRAARPRDKQYHLRDGGSLYACVSAAQGGSTSISWQYFFKWQGKTERASLGVFPEVSLAEARRRRDAAKAELAADPPRHPVFETRRREQEALAQSQADAAEKTVRALFDDWERSHLAKKRKDGGKEFRAVFERDVFPMVGDVKVRDIKRYHITTLIDRPLGRGARRSANILLAMLKQFFSQATIRGFVDENPTTEFTKEHAGGKDTPRARALRVDELRELGRKLPASGLGEPQQAAIRLLLATGARVGELNKALWDEFDLDAATWTIPAGHTKETRAHVVHLSDFANEQLATLARFRHGDHVLISARNKTPVEDKALSKVIRDRQLDKPHKGRSTKYVGALKLADGDWCIHDLRRTMATRMGDRPLSILPHVVEKCLAHKMVGVMAIYNQQEYLPERKAAFEAWGAQLARLFSGADDNIVELAPRARARK